MTRSGSAPESIAPAIGHVKMMLFRPFDIGRWVTLGFVAFLAYLGEGGYSFNFRSPWSRDDGSVDFLRSGVSWVLEHQALTAVILFVAILLVLVISVVFQWLSARGTFIYIDCVATNRAQIVRPWREHREIADSFFFWRLIYSLAVGLVILLLAIPLVVTLFSILKSGEDFSFSGAIFGTGMVFLSVLALLPVAFVALVVRVSLTDFVAPIQYLRGIRCSEALRIFLGLFRDAPGAFILYFVFKVLMMLVVVACVLVLGCATCCVGFCCLAIPILHQILLQPVFLFNRSFSLFFLQGFGPEFDVFGPSAPGGGMPRPQPPAPQTPPPHSYPGPGAPPWGSAPTATGTQARGEGAWTGSAPSSAEPPTAWTPQPPARPASIPLSEWLDPAAPAAAPSEPPLAPQTPASPYLTPTPAEGDTGTAGDAPETGRKPRPEPGSEPGRDPDEDPDRGPR